VLCASHVVHTLLSYSRCLLCYPHGALTEQHHTKTRIMLEATSFANLAVRRQASPPRQFHPGQQRQERESRRRSSQTSRHHATLRALRPVMNAAQPTPRVSGMSPLFLHMFSCCSSNAFANQGFRFCKVREREREGRERRNSPFTSVCRVVGRLHPAKRSVSRLCHCCSPSLFMHLI
jgi:hypothetical protein